MTVTVMSGAARALVLELEAVGVDPAPYLREAGLSLAEVLDPDQRLPAGRTEVLWRAAAEHVGDRCARLPRRRGSVVVADAAVAVAVTPPDRERAEALSFVVVTSGARLRAVPRCDVARS